MTAAMDPFDIFDDTITEDDVAALHPLLIQRVSELRERRLREGADCE